MGSVAPLSPVPNSFQGASVSAGGRPALFRKNEASLTVSLTVNLTLCHSLELQLPHGMVCNIAHSSPEKDSTMLTPNMSGVTPDMFGVNMVESFSGLLFQPTEQIA